MTSFDEQKMFKLAPSDRFFDINDLWYFPNLHVVRWLYPLSISPNQITYLSLIMGFISIGFYLSANSYALMWGGLFLYAKLFFDNVDGPLARSRNKVSRLGRFLDSFSDFIINTLIYSALTFYLVQKTKTTDWWPIGLTALLSCFIHCSLFVFYLVQYTSRVGSYKENRLRETITAEDKKSYTAGNLTSSVYYLQQFHEWVYDWQDLLIENLDKICRRIAGVQKQHFSLWYLDKTFLSACSPLCLCTNTMALIVFSLFNEIEVIFPLIIVLGNFYLVGIVTWKIIRFRKIFLRQ